LKIEYLWYSIYFISHPSSKSENQIIDTHPGEAETKILRNNE